MLLRGAVAPVEHGVDERRTDAGVEVGGVEAVDDGAIKLVHGRIVEEDGSRIVTPEPPACAVKLTTRPSNAESWYV